MAPRILFHIIPMLVACLFLTGCPHRPPKPIDPQQSLVPGFPRPGLSSGQIGEVEAQRLQAQLQTIYFNYDNFNLSPEAQAALQADAEILKSVPNAMVVAEGHCDERGTAEYNLALGDRRARAAVDFLVSLGLPPNRFSIVSYGSELPDDHGHSEDAWSKNRRVYFRVSK